MFTPFDSNVPIRMDAQELVFDHVFTRLGVEGSSGGGIGHPLLVTEPVCMPAASRGLLSELLFECYNAPSVCYAIDALCSNYLNARLDGAPERLQSALIITSSFHKTHVLPIVDGVLSTPHVLRMSLGGYDLESFLLGFVAVKAPRLTWSIAAIQALIQGHCYAALDYPAEMAMFAGAGAAAQTRTIQMPFTRTVRVALTEAERAAKHADLVERGKHLQAASRQKRIQKLEAIESRVRQLETLQASAGTLTKAAYRRALEASSFESDDALATEIAEAASKVAQMRAKLFGETLPVAAATPMDAAAAAAKAEAELRALFPLLYVPDEGLTEEQLDAKRKQKSLEAMRRGRETQRLKREQERAESEAADARTRALREQNPDAWLANLRTEKAALEARRLELERQRGQLQDRHSAASKKRMQLLARHASAGMEADFGEQDEHWAVYRELAGDAGDSDEDERRTRLDEIEALLQQHDPSYLREDTARDEAEDYQLRLGVERVRVPEILFQPSIIGSRQCGLSETVELALRRLGRETAVAVTRNVFVTGAPTSFPQFAERVAADLVSILPFQAECAVRRARDPILDAWRGAAAFAASDAFAAAALTRAEYLERGPQHLRVHALSNRS